LGVGAGKAGRQSRGGTGGGLVKEAGVSVVSSRPPGVGGRGGKPKEESGSNIDGLRVSPAGNVAWRGKLRRLGKWIQKGKEPNRMLAIFRNGVSI